MDGRSGVGHVITIFLGWVDYHILLAMRLRRCARKWCSTEKVPPKALPWTQKAWC